ncbi:VOC family protein [Mariniflexile litorale]|uniref:VOC family protein n=1 Tax=Mariniflexile litorale TaxID=3045158 RepID=A0AAU7EC32_9FLAO|nr:VOC family protein [Mariniflexile sp. KMM 9835]MDQ8213293.1 VOC family protein [Mariniflexile sp. KMM 9835]
MKKDELIKLKVLHTNLMVDDVTSTIFFYEKIGFEVVQKAPNKKPEWAYIKKDNASLMFQSTSSLQKEFIQLKEQKMGGGLTIWIQVENIKEYYNQIKDEAEVLKPLGVTEYNGATEFVIQDLNGFILHFSNLEL